MSDVHSASWLVLHRTANASRNKPTTSRIRMSATATAHRRTQRPVTQCLARCDTSATMMPQCTRITLQRVVFEAHAMEALQATGTISGPYHAEHNTLSSRCHNRARCKCRFIFAQPSDYSPKSTQSCRDLPVSEHPTGHGFSPFLLNRAPGPRQARQSC